MQLKASDLDLGTAISKILHLPPDLPALRPHRVAAKQRTDLVGLGEGCSSQVCATYAVTTVP